MTGKFKGKFKSKPFHIARSRTGLGLFAAAAIKRRALVVEYSGPRIPTRTAREKERLKANKYLFEINNSWTIDGASRRNMARYVNHSCRPNCEAELVRGKMMYRALRNIPGGAELTAHYGKNYKHLYFGKTGCRCTACRAKRARLGRHGRK
jgi:SET domain-containing protein